MVSKIIAGISTAVAVLFILVSLELAKQVNRANQRIGDCHAVIASQELRIKEADIALLYLLQDFRNLKAHYGKNISTNK